MNKDLTTEELTAWLEKIGKNRKWLAGEMGLTIKAVEKWYFTKRIPQSAQKTIALLREREQEKSTARPRFTPQEYDQIQSAMRDLGCETVHEFIERAVVRMAEEITEYKTKKKPDGSGTAEEK